MDVVNLQDVKHQMLRAVAVFATMVGGFGDALAQRGRHAHGKGEGKIPR